MKLANFKEMKRIEEEFDTFKLEVGDVFLFGSKMIGQLESKLAGDQISYYEIISADGKRCEYTTRFDYLQK